MDLPNKLTDPFPVKVLHDPRDNTSMTYSFPGYLVYATLYLGQFAVTLWTITAFVYWFVFMYGVIF